MHQEKLSMNKKIKSKNVSYGILFRNESCMSQSKYVTTYKLHINHIMIYEKNFEKN